MTTTAAEIAVQPRETATHTVTYWHGEITVYVEHPEGGMWVSNFRCVHNHDTRDAAQRCEDRMVRLAKVHGSELAEHTNWVTNR